MNKITAITSVAAFSLFSIQCSEKNEKSDETSSQTPGAEMTESELVESGTYTGVAHKVDPEEKEIYMKLDDGKIIEMYLKESTKLMKGSEEVGFDSLKEGQTLEVEVEKSNEMLNPISVKIVE